MRSSISGDTVLLAGDIGMLQLIEKTYSI